MLPLNHFDYLIVGQGLAGTALGWSLQQRGYRTLIVDRGESITSSKIAAGLITPITGLRLVVSWRLEEFLPFAVRFYREIEALTGSRFLELNPMLRLFASEQEQEQYQQRSQTHFPELVSIPEPLANESEFDLSQGGFEMQSGGKLDVPTYLEASREWFQKQNCFLKADIDPQQDLAWEADQVQINRLGVSADKIIFCQGIQARHNPWFEKVPFEGVKGEILTLKIPGLTERRVVNRGVWLAHWQDDLYRAGSTYDREHLDCEPTAAGREEIMQRLSEFLKVPFEVVEHRAAVRPVIRGRLPVLGLHPENSCVGFFNGFASKGSLQTPWMAAHFADVLEDKATPEKQLDLSRKLKPKS
ncbi:MAG: NAD(P)/FAD-dependent oxidoreductase [Gimesia chilikensis]|uniref:NAD(P)/FAD-dependent oxidoreductase n=1 Tax=Gimesia chilikensis TaxID=2605989 RepID=UPI0037ADA6E5